MKTIIGYWRQSIDSKENLPFPQERFYPKDIKEKTIKYLEKGKFCGAYKGSSVCRVCGCSNGSEEFTDGKFIWPSGYIHYIRDHNIMIDSELLSEILTQKL